MSGSASHPERDQPGKIRTWWHPLLVSVLRWQLADRYQVVEEVNVGKKPLQIDVLLLRRRDGELPEDVRRMLAGIVEHLREYTLIEFKSPSDTLRAGDFQTFAAYAMLYRAQNHPLLPTDRLGLLVIAPRLTRPYREELRTCGVTPDQEALGVWHLRGGVAMHPTWVLETEVLAGTAHPLLTVFSPHLLAAPHDVSRQLREKGYGELVTYVSQQIQQFQLLGEDFTMQHLTPAEEMAKVWRGLVESMPMEQRLWGVTPKQLVDGLSPEQRKEVFALLQKEVQEGKKPRRRKKT